MKVCFQWIQREKRREIGGGRRAVYAILSRSFVVKTERLGGSWSRERGRDLFFFLRREKGSVFMC